MAPMGIRLASSQTELQFPTFFMARTYEGVDELNRALSQLMLRLEKKERDVSDSTSTVGGFQTGNGFLERNEPEVVTLRQMIGAALEDYLPNS